MTTDNNKVNRGIDCFDQKQNVKTFITNGSAMQTVGGAHISLLQ